MVQILVKNDEGAALRVDQCNNGARITMVKSGYDCDDMWLSTEDVKALAQILGNLAWGD